MVESGREFTKWVLNYRQILPKTLKTYCVYTIISKCSKGYVPLFVLKNDNRLTTSYCEIRMDSTVNVKTEI